MGKLIVTIARQYGSGGKTIGQMLAENLGVNCYNREILRMASDDSGIKEELFNQADEKLRNNPLFGNSTRIYKGGLIQPDHGGFVSADNLFNYQAKVIKELAEKESCVFIGRCADFVLKGKKKKDKKDTQIEDLTDKLRRQMAEFDNFRKRTEKEKSGMFEMGAKSVVEKLLPVVDNFERGLASVPEDQKEDPFVAGVDKVYKQLLTVFDELGVKPIEAVGQPFDPNFHNAVMHVEDDEQGENVVIEEFQKGYMYHDSVVRHSMVKVAN